MKRSILLLTSLWTLAVGAGSIVLTNYETKPGPSAPTPSTWPSDSGLSLDPRLATLVLLVHPQCPCSHASVHELAQIVAQGRGRVSVQVLFYLPAPEPLEWAMTDLWHAAADLPGVAVSSDRDGTEARRFGARTSGQAFLYAPTGDLLYSGGITGSRGHPGDNAGRSEVLSLLQGEKSRNRSFPVFGCLLSQ